MRPPRNNMANNMRGEIILGDLVATETHSIYVCRISTPAERKPDILPTDYEIGTLVLCKVARDGDSDLSVVGMIIDTQIVNPHITSPPLLLDQKQALPFSPDLDRGCMILVRVLALGTSQSGTSDHTMPSIVPPVYSQVWRCSDADVEQWHKDKDGLPYVGYITRLITSVSSDIAIVVCCRIGKIAPHIQPYMAMIEHRMRQQQAQQVWKE